jgi:hypothetical protein
MRNAPANFEPIPNYIRDAAERQAYLFLRSLGYTDVIHEPVGNRPPDFGVEGQIAVEVRRLNENEPGEQPRGLAEVGVPFRRLILRELAAHGAPLADGQTWWVSYSLKRPLPPWKRVKAEVKAALARFATLPEDETEYDLCDWTVNLRFRRADAPVPDRKFVLAISLDDDSGGFVVAEVVRNLRLCIADKIGKVTPFLKDYAEWWLVLPDLVALANLDDREIAEVRNHIDPGPFRRIALLDPRNHRVFHDIC